MLLPSTFFSGKNSASGSNPANASATGAYSGLTTSSSYRVQIKVDGVALNPLQTTSPSGQYRVSAKVIE